MTLRRVEDAENETKTETLTLRLGPVAKATLEKAARYRGLSANRYTRDAILRQAIADVVEADTAGWVDPGPPVTAAPAAPADAR